MDITVDAHKNLFSKRDLLSLILKRGETINSNTERLGARETDGRPKARNPEQKPDSDLSLSTLHAYKIHHDLSFVVCI